MYSLVKYNSLTGRSSHEELNRPGTLAQKLQPLPWDDSHQQCLHRQRLHHQGRATGGGKCVISLPKLYIECRMFSLYGASRDNDRCCPWFGDCEISLLIPSKSIIRIGISTGLLNVIFDCAISGTSGYTAGKPATRTSTHGRLRYTRGHVSLA